MAVVRNVPTSYDDWTESFDCSEDISALQWCAVTLASSAAGGSKAQAAKPSGQGTLTIGIMQNAPTFGTDRAEVRIEGTSKAKAHSTFNTGAELTVHDTNGKLETAASSDYVVAIALEAATCANALVKVMLVGPYQKG